MSRTHIHTPRHLGDTIADVATSFSGSWMFLLLHIAWFTLWIVLRVEPFPFGLLTMLVSLEAIILSTLVLMSQNRLAAKDALRDDTEAFEVQKIYEGHELLLQINQQQIEILRRQDEVLDFLRRRKEVRQRRALLSKEQH